MSHSYLDLTSIADVGAHLISPTPAWLFGVDEPALLWANACGVSFLGARTVTELIDGQSAESPAFGQEDIIRRLTNAPTIADLHLADDVRDIRCLVQRIALPGGAAAMLAVGIDAPPHVATLAVRAARLCDALAGDEMGVALCRDDGRILAISEQVAGILNIAGAIAGVVDQLDGKRLIKRVEPLGDGRRPIGAALAETPEGRLTLVIIGPAITAPAIDEPDGDTAARQDRSAREIVEATDSSGLRFTFRIDADQQVTSVSPEFVAIVGPRSADISGKRWSEIAARLGIDAGRNVELALARRDTWSGVVIDWPTEDPERRVSLSLTALPSFDASGAFVEYRGFGVARPIARDGEPGSSENDTGDEIGLGQSEATERSEGQTTTAESNVVMLPTASGRPAPPQASADKPTDLSGDEQDAFRRIAEALRALGPPRQTMRPPTRSEADVAGKPPETSQLPEAGETRPAIDSDEPHSEISVTLLDRIPIGLLVYRDRQLLFANRALLDRLGYADADAFTEAGGVDGLFAEAGESPGDSSATCTIPLRARDGRVFAAEALLHIVPWERGPATMLSIREPADAASGSKVTQHASEGARIGELEAVLDTATDGIVMVDREGRILTMNRSAEALFGIESNDLLGHEFTELLAEESRQSALDYLDGLASNGVASVLNDGREVIGKVPAGGLIPIFMTMGRLSEQGKFCAVLRDITHWKRAEEELVTARRSAEAANQQKSEFLAKISHELRTPLNAIIGFSDIILDERFGPIGVERYREYLKDIRLSGTHLASLINDLLDLSRIESGKLDLAFEAVSLNGLIQDSVALMQPDANRRRVIIRTSLAADVPNVVADQRSIRQILLNVLSNAVKFNSEGGQVIVSTALDNGGEVVLRVRDTGIGMTEAEIETALKPFQQIATSSAARFEGTGLGLPLTKALVEANRAQFDISSARGEGTLIKIAFPVERVLQG